MSIEPLVSILCTAYNHEPYIRDTIEGFLKQKTQFRFEIIIHDDASTDRTAEVIREYHKKYPKLIQPILQSVNQYSKGVRITQTFLHPRARGKYIALCEGDDFWTDEQKLQMQIDYMEANPHCSLCCHAHQRVDYKTKGTLRIKRMCKRDCIITVGDLITGRKLPQLCTFVYRRRFIADRPGFFTNTPVGDVPLVIYCALVGDVHYINKVMASYRVQVPGSWTQRHKVSSAESKRRHRRKMINFFKALDQYTAGQYHQCIAKRISFYYFNNDISAGNYKSAMMRLYFKDASVKKKILILLSIFYPHDAPFFAWPKQIIRKYLFR